MGSMSDQSTMPENVVKRVPLPQDIGEYLEPVRTAPVAHARSAARLLLAWKASFKVQLHHPYLADVCAALTLVMTL